MNPHEQLRHAQAERDHAVDGILLSLDEDETAFRTRLLALHRAAQRYGQALTAAGHVREEVGEAYQQDAKNAVRAAGAFARFVVEHRIRRGFGDNAGNRDDIPDA